MALSKEQQMLLFSYLAYVGFDLPARDHHNAHKNFEQLKYFLENTTVLDKAWQIVWGPATYRFPGVTFADNMMYVVQNKLKPSEYVIAIRGTNPVAVSNWVIEDFLVSRQVKWRTGPKKKNFNPKISFATHIGLNILVNKLKVAEGLPGEGKDITSFLTQEIASNPATNISVTVTGHSLGGALSPTLALWLKENQIASDKAWDPLQKTQLSCIAFAGPSPGNKDFAWYFEKTFEDQYQRIHNTLDVVTHAWNTGSLLQLFDLYEPRYRPSFFLKSFFCYLISSSVGRGYTQLKRHSLPIESQLHTLLPDYTSQALYQHALSYLELLNIKQHINLRFLEEALGFDL